MINNEKSINDILLTKLIFLLSPTNHQLDDNYKNKFKKIILDNLDKDTTIIKKLLRKCWEE